MEKSLLIYISIPLWADCKATVSFSDIAGKYISIPLWADCKCALLTRGEICKSISIPLWADCKRQRNQILRQHRQFQFHYGLIVRREVIKKNY